jgi:hypothetical protein
MTFVYCSRADRRWPSLPHLGVAARSLEVVVERRVAHQLSMLATAEFVLA